jgi:hypothetical protein
MKEKNYIPGPAKAMYAVYLSSLAVVLYTGFYLYHPWSSGWRYPWVTGLTGVLNFLAGWIMALTAFVYLYYSTLGRPKVWREPLFWFRLIISLVSIWFFLLIYAVYQPYGWLHGLVLALGGVMWTVNIFETFLWVMLLLNVIYLYARWVKSDRYPHLVSRKTETE